MKTFKLTTKEDIKEIWDTARKAHNQLGCCEIRLIVWNGLLSFKGEDSRTHYLDFDFTRSGNPRAKVNGTYIKKDALTKVFNIEGYWR